MITPPTFFYILYGIIKDKTNNKAVKIEEIGTYGSRDEIAQVINRKGTAYDEYFFKEDTTEELPEFVFGPYLDVAEVPTVAPSGIPEQYASSNVYQPIKQKPIIICIVGASGSGKTTLSLHLQDEYNIPTICSYTTRPMREGETNFVEHIFVDDFINENSDDLLAYTMYGGYHYWTTHNQVSHHNIVTYVINRRGLDEFINKWSDRYHIVSVLITRDNLDNIDDDRKARDLENPTDGEYDLIINNNYETIEEFLYQSVDVIKDLVTDLKKQYKLN